MPNLDSLLCLEPSKKFVVGGWVGVKVDFSVLFRAKNWTNNCTKIKHPLYIYKESRILENYIIFVNPSLTI